MLMELNNLIPWPAFLITLFVFAVFFPGPWDGWSDAGSVGF